MPNTHLYVYRSKTACGLPIAGGGSELSLDPDRVDCSACLFALLPQGVPTSYCDA